MKIQLAVLATLSSTLGALATIPIVGTYVTLYNRCIAAGGDTYVSVLYGGTTGYVNFAYGKCYPYQIGDDLAQQAVFCKTVTCYNNPNRDCTGGAVPPVPVLVPAGLTLVNAADFVQLIGQGATCWNNPLSNV